MKTNFLKEIKNFWWTKCLSVGVALIIYLVHQNTSVEKKTFFVPVQSVGREEFLPANAYLKKISVSLRGNAEDLPYLTENDFTAKIDFSTCKDEGAVSLPVKLELSDNAREVKTLEIHFSPQSIPVIVQKRVIQEKPLEPYLFGSVEEGHFLSSFEIEPKTVKISGLESDLDKIQSIPLQLDVRSTKYSYFDYVDISSLPLFSDERISLLSPLSIKFSAEILPMLQRKIFVDVPINFSNLSSTLIIEKQILPLNIELEGELDVLNDFEFTKNLALADCSLIQSEGIFDVPVEITLPNKLKRTSEATMTVRIQIEER